MMDDCLALLTMLQMTDTGFPTGGFSHSVGLEAADKHGVIKTSDDYKRFLTACVENAASQQLAFVKAAYEAHGDTDTIISLDQRCESCLPNHVTNRASQRQGRSFTETCSKTFPDRDFLQRFQQHIISGDLIGHHSVAFGAICWCLCVPPENTSAMFMYSTLKNMVAASVRLGRTGTMEAQAVQYQLQQLVPDIIKRNAHLTVEDVHVKFPSVDILQNLHDTMFSKLFYS